MRSICTQTDNVVVVASETPQSLARISDRIYLREQICQHELNTQISIDDKYRRIIQPVSACFDFLFELVASSVNGKDV